MTLGEATDEVGDQEWNVFGPFAEGRHPNGDTLTHHAWPGNVRELQNVIERAVIGTTGRTLLMPNPDRRVHRPASSARTLAEVEREHILATLDTTSWVIGGWNGAAARLGLSRTTLISRMQRLGIAARNGGLGGNAARARDARGDVVP